MRKVISIILALVLVLGLTSMTVSASDPALAGNETIDRPSGPDSWVNFYLADRNNVFMEDSVMTGFSAYVKRLSPFKFMVFTEGDDSWEVVYESELVIPTEIGIYTEDISPAVIVPAGSCVGLYYLLDGAVPFTVSGNHFEAGTLDKAVLFTGNNNGPEFVDFYNSGDRIYSIQALGFVVPETSWITPISKEGYMMNVKATLPVKFQLDGEYADVKLMINGEEVEIDYKECDECDNFYMGLFRPSESGEYTAVVLVNGAPVLTKDFIVFENASNGNVKAMVKVKANNGLAKGKKE